MIRYGAGIMLGVWGLVRSWGRLSLFVFLTALTVRAAPVRAAFVYTAPVSAAHSNQPTVEELKARLASTGVGDRPQLCVQIAQKQLAEADRLYAAEEVEKGQATLDDVVAYSELARDYAIQSHKHQKETEIAARTMTRKLTDLLHALGHDDQPPVRNAITRLQKVRDALLKAMFPKGAK